MMKQNSIKVRITIRKAGNDNCHPDPWLGLKKEQELEALWDGDRDVCLLLQ